MKKYALILFLMIATFTAFAQEVSTYQYKNINGEQLKLDVYQPSTKTGNAPVIIFFHGGGFVTGNKEQMKEQCLFFSERGFVTVSANYHLLPKGDPSAQSQVAQCIRDAKSAVRWIKENAEKLQLDTNMVLLGGGSAGGFLATEVALNNDINENSDNFKISTKAKALVLYNPAYIPEKRYNPNVLNLVNKLTPPSILFFGSEDKFKPGGEEFLKLLNQNKITSELWVAKGENHGFFNKEGWKEASNIKAINFLRKIGLAIGAQEKEPSDFALYPLDSINK
ncbi:alpha/beta hydrolase [Pedobacter psychrophilus]|nr:alpha/beta hydrolase [Pedobacter psychrophilus]